MSIRVIDLKPEYREIVSLILRRYLPSSSKVWVFGSRSKGRARRYSDIDLIVDMSGKVLPLEILTDLGAAFEDSELPFKVDIVDLNTVSEEFKQMIEQEKIELEF